MVRLLKSKDQSILLSKMLQNKMYLPSSKIKIKQFINYNLESHLMGRGFINADYVKNRW